MTNRDRVRRGPPLGRHVAAMAVILVLGVVSWQVHGGEVYLEGAWNLVLADISLVLLCLILMLGPAARFVPGVRPLVPWGRELGIGMFVTAGVHFLILLDGGWDVLGFFYERDPIQNLYGFENPWAGGLGQDIWSAANFVGLVALGYAVVLAATSNDWSQRALGRGWKFLQRQTYTLFVLVWLHTVVWVLLGHDSAFVRWFFAFATLAVVAQFAGFIHTVRARRGPSPQRVPARTKTTASSGLAVGAAKWVAVTALWGGLIIGSMALAAAKSPEILRFCERYEELQHLTPAEMEEGLADYVPATEMDDEDEEVPIFELIEECKAR